MRVIAKNIESPQIESTPPPAIITRRRWPVQLIALATLGSGLVNLYSVIGAPLPERAATLRGIFPIEFLHLSRFLTLLIGFALVVLSVNLFKRKRRAFVAAVVLACFSIAFHLTKGLDYEEGSFSLLLLISLIAGRRDFTVKSRVPDLRDAFTRLGLGLLLTVTYGIAGFWLLDRREFNLDFTLHQAFQSTVSLLLLSPEPYLSPHTSYARWFLESFYLITAAAITYGIGALFKPILYRYRTQPHEQARARDLAVRYGHTSLDFFKYWPDKSHFFSENRQAFLAYRVAGGVAISLGDPIGPPQKMYDVLREFIHFCTENDWSPAFYQTTPDYLFTYRGLGLHKLKIGDDAVVDLTAFSLEGKNAKRLRSKINGFATSRFRFQYYDAPVPDDVLHEAKAVSDDWLRIPGRRERAFSLGMFTWNYLKQMSLAVVVDPAGQMLAFANLIPSYAPGRTTVDLMRHRADAPNGTMDYLFVNLFEHLKKDGFKKFDMGMAPMSGFREYEEASPEEKAVHYFFQRMNFLFSFSGLMHYKAKFASLWEPRYLVYRNVLELPRVALALAKVSQLEEET
jgi:phosphatidylglycerol lysyltransferase